MPRKTIICRCEDVTEAQIRKAIADGFSDIESLKRYLSLGTGPCQAKGCMVSVANILSEIYPEMAGNLRPITPRPPLFPTELGLFAADDGEDRKK